MPAYFADPYSSWQRGTNENRNGRIRRYLPKKTPFDDLTQAELDAIAKETDDTPMKQPEYKTPNEAGDEETSRLQSKTTNPKHKHCTNKLNPGSPGISRTLDGGVRGIRTLEPQSATNTLAGCPYRPLRHDSNLELCRSNGATAVYYTTPDGLDALYVANVASTQQTVDIYRLSPTPLGWRMTTVTTSRAARDPPSHLGWSYEHSTTGRGRERDWGS